MRGVTKRFPGVIANDRIDLKVMPGEIHALLGENGAGKTTLMNVLYGLLEPDEGEVLLKGKPVKITDPNTAISLGIGMVHQHFMLVPPFTVAENIILGREPLKKLGVSTRINPMDRRQAAADVRRISSEYGLEVDPGARVGDLPVGVQQRVEILKALYRGAEVLILDEPTAVLTPQEVDELLKIMRALADSGKAIIFITHKLREVKIAADKVTVIRRGKVVGHVADPHAATTEELARMMVGREVALTQAKSEAHPGPAVLKVEDLTVRSTRGLTAVENVSFEVHAGEIVGIAGVEGNGQTELIEAITGMARAQSGKISIVGENITNHNPRYIGEHGVAHIPQDRHKHGLVLTFSLTENAILETHYQAPFAKGSLLNLERAREYAEALVAKYDVRTPGVGIMAKSLSGGNQQKMVVAREIEREPILLVAAQPTRGLDVGAIEFIHKRLLEQRAAGKAVLLISLELEEIMGLADRILVMYEGDIIGEVEGSKATEQQLGLLMAGQKAAAGGVEA
jgi:simple sugar transport system ATP-binding protein